MRQVLWALAFCGSSLTTAAKAAELPAFTLKEAFQQGAPHAVTGRPLALGAQAGAGVFHTSISNLEASAIFQLDETYQLGDEWGKKPVTAEALPKESAVFQRAAKATARFGGGTSFYLGKFNGRHVMATNNHVMRAMGCGGRKAEFVLLNKSFPCEKAFGNWKEVDLALFSIKVPAEDEAALDGLGGNFAYDAAIYPGQELLTIGFGIADNPRRHLVANQDSDCKVFSGRNEFRFMADPDELNPGRDKVWSFANGCDISHGDSGSSYVDRKTGEVLGIVWTGRIPKSAQVGSSRYLDEMLRSHSGEIWTELSYTVPAASIKNALSASLASGALEGEAADVVSALIGSGSAAVASR